MKAVKYFSLEEMDYKTGGHSTQSNPLKQRRVNEFFTVEDALTYESKNQCSK